MNNFWISSIKNDIQLALKDYKNIYVIVMGSTARGEETYYKDLDSNVLLLSDFEMLIIIENKTYKQSIDRHLKKIREKYIHLLNSPSFDLEWSFKLRKELKKLDKRFIFYETKEVGDVIVGNKEILNDFPKITIKNLNYSELNTILIHRLYHVLRDYNILDDHYQKYLIARNTLDISTAILPLMGYLIPTYKKRQVVISNLYEYHIPNELIKRMNYYLEMKLNYDSDYYNQFSLIAMKENFIRDMKFLFEMQTFLQKGVSFKFNKRMLLSAIYRRNIKMIKLALYWNKYMNSLYNSMIDLLNQNEISYEDFNEIKRKMNQCFNYQ